MTRLDLGHKTECSQEQAKAANQIRDHLLGQLRTCLDREYPPEHPAVQELIHRYRREYVDVYLFPSTPIQIHALGMAFSLDPHYRKECEAYGVGLADYLAAAMQGYYLANRETEK